MGGLYDALGVGLNTLVSHQAGIQVTGHNIANVNTEGFHRQQVRKVLGVHYPERLSNAEVYRRSNCHPLRYDLLRARWKSFGHILRRDPDIPANMQMESYFKCNERKWTGKKTICLPLRLHMDLNMIGKKLQTSEDLVQLRTLAQDREKWMILSERLLNALMRKYKMSQ